MAKQWGDIVKCAYCGDAFPQSRKHIKFCSKECAEKYQDEIYYPRYRKDYYEKHGHIVRAKNRARYRAKAVKAWAVSSTGASSACS